MVVLDARMLPHRPAEDGNDDQSRPPVPCQTGPTKAVRAYRQKAVMLAEPDSRPCSVSESSASSPKTGRVDIMRSFMTTALSQAFSETLRLWSALLLQVCLLRPVGRSDSSMLLHADSN